MEIFIHQSKRMKALKIIGWTLLGLVVTFVAVVCIAMYTIFAPAHLTPIARQAASKFITCRPCSTGRWFFWRSQAFPGKSSLSSFKKPKEISSLPFSWHRTISIAPYQLYMYFTQNASLSGNKLSRSCNELFFLVDIHQNCAIMSFASVKAMR